MHKILVVDDEEQIRKILTIFLKRNGFEVIQAPGGEEAIALLKSGVVMDLMITDIKMPKATGFDVLTEKNILKDSRPVIILTGSIDPHGYLPEMAKLGLELEDVLNKPIDLFALLALVKKKLQIV